MKNMASGISTESAKLEGDRTSVKCGANTGFPFVQNASDGEATVSLSSGTAIARLATLSATRLRLLEQSKNITGGQ